MNEAICSCSADSMAPVSSCTSMEEARQRLEKLLDGWGADLEPADEPALCCHQRHDEDTIRSVIEFLRSME